MIDVKALRSKRTIIVGDVNSGKTAYAMEVLNAFLCGGSGGIAVIDLAPETTRGVGGKLVPSADSDVLYLTTTIGTPRLSGTDEDEVETLARRNAREIETLFDLYLESPRDVLFVNDVSLYLQAGSMERLLQVLATAATQVINSYYGSRLGDSAFSRSSIIFVEMNLFIYRLYIAPSTFPSESTTGM